MTRDESADALRMLTWLTCRCTPTCPVCKALSLWHTELPDHERAWVYRAVSRMRDALREAGVADLEVVQ
jgi:hypothetical protein